LKRNALIISNPGEANAENYCEGVKRDVENFTSFLLSPNGGMWRASEIEKMDRPTKAAVRAKIATLKDSEYLQLIFCGHGYHSVSRDSTIVELRKGEEIDSVEFRGLAKKQTLILDCCRQRHPDIPTVMMDSMMKAARSRPLINPAECRRLFNKKITDCSSGLVVLHSCDEDETAGDDSKRGGYYSSSLLRASKEWASEEEVDTSRQFQALSIVGAHRRAVPLVHTLSGGEQNPQIEKPRSDPYFPFCIVA
jgi:hypothetical protein